MRIAVFTSALLLVLSVQGSVAAGTIVPIVPNTIVAAVGEELGGYLIPALVGSEWEFLVCDVPEENSLGLALGVARDVVAFGVLWIEEVDGRFRVRLHSLEGDDVRYAPLPAGPRDVSGITFASVASTSWRRM